MACACAAPPEAPPLESAPAARSATPRTAQPPAKKDSDLELALELDFLVSDFSLTRKQIAAESGKARYWPERLRSAWSRLIIQAGDLLDRPAGDFPRPLLFRTRISLDTDLEASSADFGPVPPPIADGYRRLLALLHRHVNAPESPDLESRKDEIRLLWPLSRTLVTSPFGKRTDPIEEAPTTRFHSGLDLAAATGDTVYAAAAGKVTFAGWLGGRGNAVVIRHGSNWTTVYAHLRELLVAQGALVQGGAPVGLAGSSGRSTGAHLHFELRYKGEPVDPARALPSPPR